MLLELKEVKEGLKRHLLPVDSPSQGWKGARRAAVLLLLYERGGRLNLLFTKRSGEVSLHRGEISFPGGAQERGEDLLATALRECNEEVGIRVPRESVLGALNDIWTVKSGYLVRPFVALLEELPQFRPDSREVSELLEVPVEELLKLRSRGMKRLKEEGGGIRVTPAYRYGDKEIWGATARMLEEFLSIYKKCFKAAELEEAGGD